LLHSGEPALIDPSSYFGHREVDLAMTLLFGGFDARFMHAYREAWPLAPGFDDLRCPVYQLYYLLVHVNLFGRSYRGACLGALRAAGFPG
jgi:fructosamine-3-kinase